MSRSALHLQDQILAFPHPVASLSQSCLLGRGAAALRALRGTPTTPPFVLSVVQEDALPSAETALILHRKGFDCGLEAKNLGFNCTTSQGKVSSPVGAGSPC